LVRPIVTLGFPFRPFGAKLPLLPLRVLLAKPSLILYRLGLGSLLSPIWLRYFVSSAADYL
jgi:hypothetical protein